MDEYAKLKSQGVYCESCGCYTGREPGRPTLCDGCTDELYEKAVENATERGEEI